MSNFAQANDRSIYVGNISFDVPEQQIRELFQQVGELESLRLVTDRETGKSKGFAFIEFKDSASAKSAIRNLNKYEINGRHIQVDPVTDRPERGERGGRGDREGRGPHYGHEALPPHMGAPPPPSKPLAHGPQVPQNQAPSEIARVINEVEPHQLFEFMKSMKGMVASKPDEARALLSQQPQLAYALFQGLIKMNILDVAAAQQMLITNPRPSSYTAPTRIPPHQNTGPLGGPRPSNPFGRPPYQGPRPNSSEHRERPSYPPPSSAGGLNPFAPRPRPYMGPSDPHIAPNNTPARPMGVSPDSFPLAPGPPPPIHAPPASFPPPGPNPMVPPPAARPSDPRDPRRRPPPSTSSNPPAPANPVSAPAPQLNEQEEQLLQQLMNVPDDEIRKLVPPEQAQQLIQLKQSRLTGKM